MYTIIIRGATEEVAEWIKTALEESEWTEGTYRVTIIPEEEES
jgi:hypothetical protein